MLTPSDPASPDLDVDPLDLDDEDSSRSWLGEYALPSIVAVLLALFMIVVFWPLMVITIRPGQEGVLWLRFAGGTIIDTIFPEGTHLIAPWNVMYIYDVRIAKVDYTVPVLSTDGLEITVDVSVRYRPVPKSVPQLHQQIGPDYVQRIVIPEVVTAVREVMGHYRPEQLYALRTSEMQEQIIAKASVRVRDRYVIVDDVLIRRIELPQSVRTAIEDKFKQEQASLEYEYRLDRETKEAMRKKIEAAGIAEFTQSVRLAGPLPETYLRWKGIEATLELAKSNNTKVIVIGSKDGLPLILNPSQ